VSLDICRFRTLKVHPRLFRLRSKSVAQCRVALLQGWNTRKFILRRISFAEKFDRIQRIRFRILTRLLSKEETRKSMINISSYLLFDTLFSQRKIFLSFFPQGKNDWRTIDTIEKVKPQRAILLVWTSALFIKWYRVGLYLSWRGQR